jgi:hypothetical protein
MGPKWVQVQFGHFSLFEDSLVVNIRLALKKYAFFLAFGTKGHLDRHISGVHTPKSLRKTKCPECGNTFAYQEALALHKCPNAPAAWKICHECGLRTAGGGTKIHADRHLLLPKGILIFFGLYLYSIFYRTIFYVHSVWRTF